MKLALVGLIAFALTSSVAVISIAPPSDAGTANTIVLDLDVDTAGVQTERLVPTGAAVEIAIVAENVVSPYGGYQWEIALPISGLNFVSNVENTAGHGGVSCAPAQAMTTGVPPGEVWIGLGAGCVLSAGATTTFAGDLVRVTVQCASDGTHSIRFVGLAEDGIYGSSFFRDGALTTAIGGTVLLSCGAIVDTPTPTPTEPLPTNTASPTPTPTRTPDQTLTPTPTATPCVEGQFCEPTPSPLGPEDIVLIEKSTCITGLTGQIGGVALGCLDSPREFGNSLPAYAEDFGDADGVVEPSDFEFIDLDGGQLHDSDGYAHAIALVDGDEPVTFLLDAGGGQLNVGNNSIPFGVAWVCDTEIEDEDCDDDGTVGDGIVVAGVCTGSDAPGCGAFGADFGPSARGDYDLTVVQNGISETEPYTIVGEAVAVEVEALELTVENGVVDLNGDGFLNDAGECAFSPTDPIPHGLKQVAATAPRTALIARLLDSDGTAVTGAWARWSTDDASIGIVSGSVETSSVDLGDFGVGAPQIFCGTAGTGLSTIQVEIVSGPPGVSGLDPNAGDGTDDVQIEVIDALPPPPTATPTATFTPCPPDTCDPPPVEDVVMLEKSVCFTQIGGATGEQPCLESPRHFAIELQDEIKDLLGDADGVIEPEDFLGVDLDAGQLHESDGFAYVLAFVNSDDAVTFSTGSGGGEFFVGTVPVRVGSTWTCDTQLEDEDCDGDGVSEDGLVVVALCTGHSALGCRGGFVTDRFGPAARGDYTLSVRQAGYVEIEPYTVVGEPAVIELEALEMTVETGVADINGDGNLFGPGECTLGTPTFNASALLSEAGTPQRTLVLARIKDSDGTLVTGGWASWQDPNIGSITLLHQTPSFELGNGLGIAAPQIFCGTNIAGTAALNASLTCCLVLFGTSREFDRNHETAMDDLQIEVLGVSSSPTPSPTSTFPSPTPVPNQMYIDADPDAPGIQLSRSTSPGEDVEIVIGAQGITLPYAGYQWEMQWQADAFDFVSNLENSAGTGATLCAPALLTADPARGVPFGFEWLGQGSGCFRVSGTTSFEGELVRITIRCTTPGIHQIDFVRAGDDPVFASQFLAQGGGVLNTVLRDSVLVSCPEPTSTPTPTETPSPTNTPQPTNTPSPTPTPTPAPGQPCADVTGDGVVGFDDVFAVVRHIGRKRFNPAYDVNGDGRVTGRDVALTIRQFGRTCFRYPRALSIA